MTPSCEAEKEDQRYFNSPPHKKNHIATTMINTVFFKISTHILTKRMTIIHSFAAPAIYISTHILTKRMTDGFPTFCILCVISTHILTKRMTTLQQLVRLSERYFNSHPHEEDDPDAAWQSATYCYFNSHPHEEDDAIQRGFDNQAVIFQLTSSRRGWQPVEGTLSTERAFQLTSSRRGWLIMVFNQLDSKYFNSHPHEEDDQAWKRIWWKR